MCTQPNSSVELSMSLTQHFQFKYAKFHTFSQGANKRPGGRARIDNKYN